MPKTNRRRTTHRKRTSQRKRKNAKRGGSPLGVGLNRALRDSNRPKYHSSSSESTTKYLLLHLILQDELGYYFSINNNNGEKNLLNPETQELFGDSNNQITPDGNYTSDDIVLPDVTHMFSSSIILPINEDLNIGKLKDFLSDQLDNIDRLRFVIPETYTNWGKRTNPVIAIRGNCLHGDEEWGTGNLPLTLFGIPIGERNGWRSLPHNRPLYRANRNLTNVFMPVL